MVLALDRGSKRMGRADRAKTPPKYIVNEGVGYEFQKFTSNMDVIKLERNQHETSIRLAKRLPILKAIELSEALAELGLAITPAIPF